MTYIISMSVLILALASQNAYSYIDPGTGSYLFQILIATLIGAFFSIKIFGKKITTFIKDLFTKNDKDNVQPPKN